MTDAERRILVLGSSGMLGNAVFRFFATSPGYQVFGSARSASIVRFFPMELQNNIVTGIDVENNDSLTELFMRVRPALVINCIGLVKQHAQVEVPLTTIPINSLLPHRLANLCALAGARLIHMSTDCVFSGAKGMYTEADISDAKDLYGRSKLLGEVDYTHGVTLRTSIIGHELNGTRSLVGWFLAQEGTVKGFNRAIFSGLPTVEIARVIRDFVIPHGELHGVYHLSAEPINKYELLKLVGQVYGKQIEVHPDESLIVDRSLDSAKFQQETGYHPPTWPELVRSMYSFG